MKKIMGIFICTLLIITVFIPTVGTLPSRTKTSTIMSESNRLIFCGLCTGPGLVGWGVNGYPGGPLIGELEYGVNDSRGFFFFPAMGNIGDNITDPEDLNINVGWHIENVISFPFMFLQWDYEGKKHNIFVDFNLKDETYVLYVKIIPFGPDEHDESVADTIFAGLNLENFTTAENLTRDSNIFFNGIYDGQRIEGRANILFAYDLINSTGLVFVNLVIENLDTLVWFGFCNEEWADVLGAQRAEILKAYYFIK